MQDLDALPTPFRKLHQFLDPYVKDRHEAARIRRVLSTNLDSAVDPEARRPLLRPLSLTQASSIVESTPHGIKGSQKEYLRYLRANVKARRDYAEASKEHQPKIKKQSHTETLDGRGFCDGSLEEFLGLVRQQQKHEVLCIIQDYVDMLRKKPAAASDHLDPKVVLGGTVTLPQVPPETGWKNRSFEQKCC
ncbi:hypothetical protein G7Y89_g6869 [Cudoniella acicularis]|uniref:Uncharacterized protein n=1 Tax=Cudoniella acicularis TaxID=354080 RepID=A0A8H4RM76_9HELO|nr:hypothetical protein G7Y89_g6869 [Cudoniella acicularis]